MLTSWIQPQKFGLFFLPEDPKWLCISCDYQSEQYSCSFKVQAIIFEIIVWLLNWATQASPAWEYSWKLWARQRHVLRKRGKLSPWGSGPVSAKRTVGYPSPESNNCAWLCQPLLLVRRGLGLEFCSIFRLQNSIAGKPQIARESTAGFWEPKRLFGKEKRQKHRTKQNLYTCNI